MQWGAYIKLDNEEALPKKRVLFNHSFSMDVPESFYGWTIAYVDHKAQKKRVRSWITQKIVKYVRLAQRAGKLISGEELVIKAVQSGQRLVSCHDGGNVTKKTTDKCNYYNM